jgi:hypothetical protein
MGGVNGKNNRMYRTVIVMMVIIKMIRKMVMEFLLGKAEMFIKEVIKTMKEMDMEKCFGSMDHIIKVIGEEEFSMDLVK